MGLGVPCKSRVTQHIHPPPPVRLGLAFPPRSGPPDEHQSEPVEVPHSASCIHTHPLLSLSIHRCLPTPIGEKHDLYVLAFCVPIAISGAPLLSVSHFGVKGNRENKTVKIIQLPSEKYLNSTCLFKGNENIQSSFGLARGNCLVSPKGVESPSHPT